MSSEVEFVKATFNQDGSINFEVGYRTSSLGKIPNPGTKGRQRLAKKMTQAAMENAYAALIDYPLEWGGFAQSPVQIKDFLMTDKKAS